MVMLFLPSQNFGLCLAFKCNESGSGEAGAVPRTRVPTIGADLPLRPEPRDPGFGNQVPGFMDLASSFRGLESNPISILRPRSCSAPGPPARREGSQV